LGPAVKVAVDGRRETVYPDAVYRKFLNFQYGLDNWDSLIRDYPTDMVLVQKNGAAYGRMSRSDWPRAYEDTISAIFVRRPAMLQKLRQSLPEIALSPVKKSFP